MPNCDFYATLEDHEPLLAWLFAEGTCEVYELSSDFEQPLRRFTSPAEVLSQFDRRYANAKPWHSVYLQLYVPGAGPPFVPRRVSLDPAACDGATYRYRAEGWGLVQLYLSVSDGASLASSHTNHNSQLRAQKWAPVCDDEPGPDAWDFARITSFSSRLNRQIRKAGVAKIESRVVLPGALKLWNSRVSLAPYQPGKHSLQLL